MIDLYTYVSSRMRSVEYNRRSIFYVYGLSLGYAYVNFSACEFI